ncbi:hypothetical protein D9V32_15500 [Mycetocola tolaasinivorans]|uniref:Uncharacterized protein n=1 Tax=Mycetocola tolaasinivorans TaxID=76635 RepID=A0A3L6ZWX6_9MICO|nr:hypothetical protein D9V32_15500 [Mycetocola tolaasinivorans]
MHPKPLQAVAVARAYGAHPLGALVAAGYLTWDDVDVVAERIVAPKSYALDDFTTSELLAEATKRLKRLELAGEPT